jgi:protein O-mannosyl-transferase
LFYFSVIFHNSAMFKLVNEKQILNMKQKKVFEKKTELNKPQTTNYLGLIIIIIATLIIYTNSINHDFTNWDDPTYVTENPVISKPISEQISFYFKNPYATNYHPLSMISLGIDFKISNSTLEKINPKTFHVTNVFFHLLNTLLVFYFIQILSNKKTFVSVFVSAIFALHPMHVESVAWISERKDVLYTFFFLIASILYLNFLENKKWIFYFLTFLFFCLSVLSKPAAIMFPFVLLCIDFYLNKSITYKTIFQKIPFFLVSIVIGIVTIKVQDKAISEIEIMSYFHRFIFASYAFMMYIIKFIYPYDLSTVYPYPVKFPIKESLPIEYYFSVVFNISLVAFSLFSLKKSRLFSFGLLYYFFMIVLVLQFISVGSMIMAERYTYVPYIGISFVLAVLLNTQIENKKSTLHKPLIYSLSIIFFGMLTFKSFALNKVWKNSETLFSNAIKIHPEKAEVAYKNRGNHYARVLSEYELAIKDYNKCLEINPLNATVLSNRGNVYGLLKDYTSSIRDYSLALKIENKNVEARINRGITYSLNKDFEKAIKDFEFAKSLDSTNNLINSNLAFAFLGNKEYQKSIDLYQKLISLNNQNPDYYFKLGVGYFNIQNYSNAIESFSKTININSNFENAFLYRAQAYKMNGNKNLALKDALTAKQQGYNADALIKELELK